MSLNKDSQAVLDFWFGVASDGDPVLVGEQLQEKMKFWFSGGEELDRQIAEKFGELVKTALAGGLEEWEQDVETSLALVLLLDQFPRNIHRGQPAAFSGDDRALRLARRFAGSDARLRLSVPQAVFLLMPYQHVEDIELQEEGVKHYSALEHSAPEGQQAFAKGVREYAELHRDIVRRFGRFPHRNRILDRRDTPEEAEWLADGAPTFGQ
ncbi:MAG: DUF924 family protein [Gammaproteobacteria bacterium]|nr:DUF924 family protein [Gammaproteobacteria bacterium]